MLYILTFILIILLIFINGFTDAPNAITTVVSTNVITFKKAAFFSAIFNVIGIICMCLINFAIADCISSIVILENGIKGIITLSSAILAVIIFAAIASIMGIPTSETHGLVSALSGSAIAMGSIKNINVNKWNDIIIGLIWSILGTYIIGKILFKFFKSKIYKIDLNKVKKYQLFSAFGLSFMHGAQDGQKFIGIILLFEYILKSINIPENINAIDNIWVIIFVSIIMFLGVSLGGRKIVENIGNNTVELDNVKGIFSDLTTVLNLFIASILGIPVSTTHVKTVSILLFKKKGENNKNIFSILKAWIYTFPACFILSYVFSIILINV